MRSSPLHFPACRPQTEASSSNGTTRGWCVEADKAANFGHGIKFAVLHKSNTPEMMSEAVPAISVPLNDGSW